MKRIGQLYELLKEGVRSGVFPGAIAGIFFEGSTYYIIAGFSSITPFPEPMEEHFLFDLASLTKPLATGLVFLDLMERDFPLALDKPLGEYLPTKGSLAEVPLFRFLNHTSGLKSWHPFYKERPLTLEKIFSLIEKMPFEYKPGEGFLYSDLNFFILTYLLERITQKSFESLFEDGKKRLLLRRGAIICFNPLLKGIDQEEIVATSIEPESGKILRGIVEDENTRALSGVSGVAGLFGNVYGVLGILENFLLSYKGKLKVFKRSLLELFFEFSDPVSPYSLAFMRSSSDVNSSSGGAFSEKTVGHLGYTGCSFFMDLEKDLIVVLLTNRVHPQRGNEKIKEFRPVFHRAVVECFNLTKKGGLL